MGLASGDALTRWLQVAMIALGAFLALEVHQLRATVEDTVADGRMRADRPVDAATSLVEPIHAIRGELAELSDYVQRRQSAARAAAPAEARSRNETTGPTRTVEPRRIPNALAERIDSLATLVRDIEKRPRVVKASIPRDATVPPIRSAAVNGTVASVRHSTIERSKLLLKTPEDLLKTYGKPTRISVGETGEVRWWYAPQGGGTWLCFVLYDGRVTAVSTG